MKIISGCRTDFRAGRTAEMAWQRLDYTILRASPGKLVCISTITMYLCENLAQTVC